MKQIFSLLISCAFILNLHAQIDCGSAYLPFKEGVTTEITNYSKKQKPLSVMTHVVESVTEGGGSYVAKIKTNLTDAKGKEITTGSYEMTCLRDKIIMDMEGMMDPSALSGMGAMDVEISGDGLVFPKELNVGEEIDGGELNCKASMGGISLMKLNMIISNRKVIAKESITTPAGTFDCVKITQTTEMKGMGNRTYETISWYAKGVGMVKSENIGKKGQVASSSMLTKLIQ